MNILTHRQLAEYHYRCQYGNEYRRRNGLTTNVRNDTSFIRRHWREHLKRDTK